MAANHYLQAALLGECWGEPSQEFPRCWKLQRRMKHKTTAEKIRAEKVARENGLYPDWLEKFWDVYESDLPRAVDNLERDKLAQGDETFLLLHIASLRSRSPLFRDFYSKYQQTDNLPPIDDLSAERIKSVAKHSPSWQDAPSHALPVSAPETPAIRAPLRLCVCPARWR